MRSLLRPLATFLAPGLLLLLVGVQVALALAGFERPEMSLLALLQVPGLLLGWGGLALLAPLLAWTLLDWWGYSPSGFALKFLGSASLGIAAGALATLMGSAADGGLVGAKLAELLEQTLGGNVAGLLLIAMCVPSGILALAWLWPGRGMWEQATASAGTSRTGASRTGASRTGASSGGGGTGGLLARFKAFLGPPVEPGAVARTPARASAWYPQRRYDAEGNELPTFLGRAADVGSIRFVDEGPAEAPPEPALEARVLPTEEEAPERAAKAPREGASDDGEERWPTIPELFSGAYRGDLRRGESDSAELAGDASLGDVEEEDDGPVHVDSEGRPVKSQRPAAGGAAKPPVPIPVAEVAADVEEPPVTEFRHVGTGGPTASVAVRLRAPDAEEGPLPPGVRYADEPADGGPADGRPADGGPADGGPADGGPADGRPADGRPADEGPAVGARGERKSGDAADAGPAAGPGRNGTQAHTARDLERALQDPDAAPSPAATRTAVAETLDRTLRRAVSALTDDEAARRYVAKLDACGIFDTTAVKRAPDPESGRAKSGGKGAARKTSGRKNANSARSESPERQVPSKPDAEATPKKGAKRKTRPRTRAASPRRTAPSEAYVRVDAPATTEVRAPRASRSSHSSRSEGRPAGRPTLRKTRAESAVSPEVLRAERRDAHFRQAVETALERGSASPVLFSRRLGLGYAEAHGLVLRLVEIGVLGERGESGAHPTLLTREDWEATR